MKILIISSYFDTLTAVRPEGEMLIAAHQSGQVEIDVMTQGDAPFVHRFRESGMRVIDFHPVQKFDQKAVEFIRSILIKNNYDILHLFNNKAIVNGIRAARNIPIQVMTYRGVVGNVNWYDPTSYLTHLHPRVNGITALSDAVNVYLKNQLWWSKKKTYTVPKGQQEHWFNYMQTADLQQFSVPREVFITACVANVRKVKGIPDLIAATHYLNNKNEWHFLLIGKDMNTSHLQKLMNDTPHWVHFYLTGFQNDILPLIAACDLYVQPSRMEGLGKTVQEAMMLEKPVVATAVGGLKDLIIDNQTGLAVSAKSPQDLAQALERMRANSNLRQRLAQAGKKWILQKFSVQESATRLVRAYADLLA